MTQDFRVGVITTSVYRRAFFNNREEYREYDEAGKLRPVPTASGGVSTERFIESSDPELLTKFSRLVQQGTSGSGQEAPFEAVRRAELGGLKDVQLATLVPLRLLPLLEAPIWAALRRATSQS